MFIKNKFLISSLIMFLLSACHYTKRKTFYSNRKIETLAEYNNKGKRDGTYKYYYNNGQLGIIVNYNNGKKEGIYKKYYKNGLLHQEGWYFNDSLNGFYREYDSNGIIVKARFKHGEQNGYWLAYYSNGNPILVCSCKNGVLNGNCWAFYANGALRNYRYYQTGYKVYKKEYDSATGKVTSIIHNIVIEAKDTLFAGERFKAKVTLAGPLNLFDTIYETGINFSGEYLPYYLSGLVPCNQGIVHYLSDTLAPGNYNFLVFYAVLDDTFHIMHWGERKIVVLPNNSKLTTTARTYKTIEEKHWRIRYEYWSKGVTGNGSMHNFLRKKQGKRVVKTEGT